MYHCSARRVTERRVAALWSFWRVVITSYSIHYTKLYEVESFLREYNLYSLQNLTIHEAVPGHYLQFALSNRHPSVLRSALWSGTFVEGWAVYAERVMIDAGYLDDDPLMRLINRKWRNNFV